jgi:hypothetical protein
MALTLDDVLGGEPRFRTKLVDYGNDISFTLHAFDADEFQKVATELTGDQKNNDDYAVALSMRAISGQDFEPDSVAIAKFRTRLDKGVIEAILLDWVAFNRGAENLADAAKKS